ncbi:glycosyltransferase family 2 protein [Thermophilibacter sp.]
MRIRQELTCRGSGKVFTLMSISDLPEGSRPTVSASTADGRTIPAAVYPFSKDLDDDPGRFVAVLPILDTGSCELTLVATSADGTALAYATTSVSFSTAKWESRLNYRLRESLSLEVRDYDRVGRFEQATMEFWDCIEDGDEVILRCLVRTPYFEDSNVTVSCLDSGLKPVKISPIVSDRSRVALDFSPEQSMLETLLSIRLPNVVQRLIFLVSDAAHPASDNFAVLDDRMFEGCRAATRRRMAVVSAQPNGYALWLEKHSPDTAALRAQRAAELPGGPVFSVVVPLYKTPLDLFDQMVDSVLRQSYSKWELVLVDASPDDEDLFTAARARCTNDARIKLVMLDGNRGISGNTWAGIERAVGDYVCFLDHDDLIAPEALFSYACTVTEHRKTDLIYSDEDILSPEGTLINPFFKPDFSIDLLRNVNYINHFLCVRTSLLNELGPSIADVDGAQDHDLILRASERTRNIVHVPRVLYHWRMTETSTAADPSNKSYAVQAGIRTVQGHLDRMGIRATVSASGHPFTYRIAYAVPEPHPLVSIIIPSKDHTDVLNTCVTSILERSTYDNYEILIIENNSVKQDTFDYYEQLCTTNPNRVRVVRWPNEFNYSKLMNFGEKNAQGDYLLLLNNDTEVITPSWIEEMLGICAREDVGAVGARLYYPDDTVQHAGVIVNGPGASHLFKDLPRGNSGYYGMCDRVQDLSAVTAACLMTKRSAYEAAGGFNEDLVVSFNDVDFCLRIREQGLLVVYTPEAELYHYESLSRGYEIGDEKQIRAHSERMYLHYRWPEYFVTGDPYLNRNIMPGNIFYQIS